MKKFQTRWNAGMYLFYTDTVKLVAVGDISRLRTTMKSTNTVEKPCEQVVI